MLLGLIGAKGSGKDTLALHLVKNFGFTRLAFADKLYQEVAEAFGVTVEFLQNRETKETPTSALSLSRCNNKDFVFVARRELVSQMVSTMVKNLPLEVATALREEVVKNLQNVYQFEEVPLSPRAVLQWWGTEYRRVFCQQDSYWLDEIRRQIVPGKRYVITDVRFANEANFTEDEGGSLGRILRPYLQELEDKALACGAPTAQHKSETELRDRKTQFTFINEENGLEAFFADAVSQLKL